MECKKCLIDKAESEFYKSDKTCKPCRREMVRINREKNAEYYRQYDKDRFRNDPRVSERHKRYQKTESGRASVIKSKKKWQEKNPVKRAVHVITGSAIRSGALQKMPCEVCGSKSRVHAHHDDYSKPLEVRWLCSKHHTEWHELNGEGLIPWQK